LEIQTNESLAKIIRNPKILSVSSKKWDLFFVVGVMQTFPDGTIAVASATYSFLAVPKFLRGRFAVLLFRLASDVTR
jgi:hypothetical protein